MSANEWNTSSSGTTPDVDEFIIPDEDFEETPTPKPKSASNTNTYGSQSSSSNNNNNNTNTNNSSSNSGSGNIFSQFGFTPKVDLSSTFAPFTSSANLPANNSVRERQYNGGETLDEPILETLKRDLFQIGKRLAIVVWPYQLAQLAKTQQSRLVDFAATNGIRLPDSIIANRRISVSHDADEEETGTGIESSELINQGNLDWDLWGPLIFSLVYSVTLGVSAPNQQTNSVFSGSFSFIWIFFIVIGLNIQLLGGTISFMSAISAAGYSMFPIVVGALISALVIKWKLLRLAILVILNIWSIYAGLMSLKCSGVLPGRVLLAMYPVGLMYSVLSWLVVIT
ncbi:uncharacterized protein RJT21DRAFT_118146 [Scheffersomyces amazonensis]|uniref:uncharacterized protein n=1 Tax=Scheffersomyces amazonensis TaxID=1078765 RepID=UPI00315D981D